MRFTLDTNCIIDLEQGRPNAIYVKELIKAWRNGRIELAIVAVSASENQLSGEAIPNYSEFSNTLECIGLSNATELRPIAIWDVFYWDHCIWSSKELEDEATAIRNILFPNANHQPPISPSENSKWRNNLCDVLVAWSHLHYKQDYLVTSDRNFHKKKEQLKAVGVNGIVTPENAVNFIPP